jgi:hypothetical protein
VRILTFDISRHCGWAHDRDGGGVPFSGVEHFPSIGGNKNDGYEYGDCGAAALEFFMGKINLVKPDLIGAEAPLPPQFYRNQPRDESSAFNGIGLFYMCEAVAKWLAVPFEQANIAEWKKHFAGTSHGGKEPVKARCRQLGWKYRDDNEADALGLFSYFKSIHEPGFGYTTTPLFGRVSA